MSEVLAGVAVSILIAVCSRKWQGRKKKLDEKVGKCSGDYIGRGIAGLLTEAFRGCVIQNL